MHVFQTDFPAIEAQQLGTAILNRTHPNSELIRAAWVVAEYGLLRIYGDGVAMPAAAPLHESGRTYDPDEIAHYLLVASEEHQHWHPSAPSSPLNVMPWRQIVRAALDVILPGL